MKAMKKVSILICMFGIISFLFVSVSVAKNSDDPNGPKWKENPGPPNKPEKPEKPEKPGKPEKPEKPEPPVTPTPPENKGPKGPSGPAGKSKIGHLYLYEKVEPPQPYPPGTPWEIVEDGAWGKMKYNLRGPTFQFVFNGHQLVPGEDYTLIYYPDPWPGNGLICLGSGIANDGGNVHIMGSVETGDLPMKDDYNNPDNSKHQDCITNSTCIEGAKIWLVLSDDVECNETDTVASHMKGWNPMEYLFEDVGIFYDEI